MTAAGQLPPCCNQSPDFHPAPLFAGERTAGGEGPLLEGFLSVAGTDPGRVAVIDGGRRMTYGELDDESNRLARFLRSRGVGSGGFVGLAMGRCAELVVAIFAAVKSGGAYVPLDPSYPPGRIARMLEIAKPGIVLTRGMQATPTRGPASERAGRPFPLWTATSGAIAVDAPDAEWRKFFGGPLEPVGDDGAPIYCIFTSGSTGEPKGAVVTRGGFANLAGWYRREFRFGPEDKTLLVSAPGFDLTQKNFFVPLCSGGCLVIYPDGPFDLALVSRMIGGEGITVLNWTPSAFYPLLDGGHPGLESLRLVVLGGEPISVAKVGPWLQDPRCHAEIANTYGPTECADICAFHRLNRDNLHAFPSVPVGRPVSNVQLALLDDSLRPAAEVGELVIGGSGVGSGYLGDERRTKEKFLANPMPEFFVGPRVYRTGDLMRALPGGVLEFVGRADHQIKLRGFRIELGEIESALAKFPGVREAAVVVVGEGEAAGLVAFHAPSGLDPAALQAHLRGHLPEHMVPSRFVGMESFPMTPHGKLDRLALAKMVPGKAGSPPPATCDSTQARVRAIWSEILELPAPALDDGFFDLGGDSIRLARMHVRIMNDFRREIPITDLFAHPTIRSLARRLDGRAAGRISAKERMQKQREASAAAREARP